MSRPCTTADLFEPLLHAGCGGVIHKGTDRWSCRGCAHPGWYAHKVRRMTNALLAERFEITIEHDHRTQVLVWKDDPVTRSRYTALVPAHEAHKHERWSHGKV